MPIIIFLIAVSIQKSIQVIKNRRNILKNEILVNFIYWKIKIDRKSNKVEMSC